MKVVLINKVGEWLDLDCEAVRIPLEDASLGSTTEWLKIFTLDAREVVAVR